MRIDDRRVVGKSGVAVTVMGFGGAPLGNMYQALADDAGAGHRARLLRGRHPLFRHRAALRLRPQRAPRRRGAARTARATTSCCRPRSAACCGPGDPATLEHGQFKDALPFAEVYDYGYDGVMRSVEDSLQRLGMHRIDVLLVHDLDVWTHGSEAARQERVAEFMAGGYRAMVGCASRARSARSAPASTRPRPARTSPSAATSTASCSPAATPCSSRRRSTTFLPLCERRDIALIIGGAYNTGILATGAVPGAYFQYAPAPPEIMERVRRIEAVCARHGVRLPTAALQFPLGHPAVATVIPGTRAPAEVEQNLAIFAPEVPADLWAELKHEGLLRADAPTP